MKPNTDSPAHGEPSAARPLTVGELVEHVFSGNHGFVRSVEPDGTYTVEFSGPLVNAGYHRDELKPVAARPLAERITQGLIGRHDPKSQPITLRPNAEPSKIVANVYGNSETIEANASLIVEAFNTTHETGRTPRQLAEDVKDLRASCEALLAIVDRLHRDTYAPNVSSDWKEQADARAVLAKTEPRKQP